MSSTFGWRPTLGLRLGGSRGWVIALGGYLALGGIRLLDGPSGIATANDDVAHDDHPTGSKHIIVLPLIMRHARYIESTRAHCTKFYEQDSNSDGKSDRFNLFEMDTMTSLHDIDGDRLVDSYTLQNYDSQRRQQRSETFGVTGTPLLSAEMLKYDIRSNLISFQTDHDGNRVFEYEEQYEYDVRDNRTAIKYDIDGNGTIDSITVTVYDHLDRAILYRFDLEADGVWDSLSSVQWINTGNVETRIYDRSNDGVVDSVWKTVYDSENRPVSQDIDYSGYKYLEDVWEERIEWTYDSAGRLIKKVDFVDGAIHDMETMEYDYFGRIILKLSRHSVAQGIEKWRYSCAP